MLDLEEQIHRYAEAAGRRVPTRSASVARPHPTWPLAVAAAVLVAALVGGVVVRQVGDDGPSSVPGPSAGGEGNWSEIPEAPIDGAQGSAVVTTDDELVVWGGSGDGLIADGAVFDFDQETWRTMAPSPLSPRFAPTGVWTGEEVLFFGGTDDDEVLLDGAAYDPATDSWRSLPSLEALGIADVPTTVWTGRELILLGITAAPNAFLPSDVLALDPLTGSWRALDPVPNPDLWSWSSEWTGSTVVVVSNVHDQGPYVIDRLDPVTGAWSETITTEVRQYADAVWTGSRVALVADRHDGVLVDPLTGELTPLDESGSQVAEPDLTVALGSGVVVAADRWLGANGEWHDVADQPGGERYGPQGLAHDGRLVVWGGDRCPPNAMCLENTNRNDGLIWTPG